MLLELSEILACPVCGPPQVMVAVVHESAGRRVTRGFLGCPACDARFPIDRGAAYLAGPESGESPESADGATAPAEPLPSEAATLIAAVLDLARGSGHVLLGPHLAGIAAGVAVLADRWEVVSLTDAPPVEAPESANLSRIVVRAGDILPVLRGRLGAAALAGDPGADRIQEVARTLGPLGRLAILAPGAGGVTAMRDADLDVIATDARVAVASRRP